MAVAGSGTGAAFISHVKIFIAPQAYLLFRSETWSAEVRKIR